MLYDDSNNTNLDGVGIKNPFKNESFILHKAETYSSGCNVHKVGDVGLFFKNQKRLVVEIVFKKKDSILALRILEYLLFDPYGLDEYARVFLFNTFLFSVDYETSLNGFSCDLILTNLKLMQAEQGSFYVFYSDTEYGKNAFRYNKQCCI